MKANKENEVQLKDNKIQNAKTCQEIFKEATNNQDTNLITTLSLTGNNNKDIKITV